MTLGDKVRDAIISFLRISPARNQSYNIQEQFNRITNAEKNIIWYRGDAYELNQLYKQVGNTTSMFWASVPSYGRNIRKLHTGLPATIVDMLANITISDLQEIGIEDEEKKEYFGAVESANNITDLLRTAIIDALVVGDCAFKISFDFGLSQYPIVEVVSGERVEFERNRNRITGVIFSTQYQHGGMSYTLQEAYRYGSITYKLYRGLDKREVPIGSIPQTAGLEDIGFDESVMLAVPCIYGENKKYTGRGQSIFDAKTDNFDALDEIYSQWMQAMRDARPSKLYPENLVPRNPETGEVLPPNPFDNAYISVGSNMSENAKNEIKLLQSAFNSGDYSATYNNALDSCLTGVISPSTLGIDVKKMDNAEAQREKEKATLYTRQRIIDVLTPVIIQLVTTIFAADAIANGQAPAPVDVVVTFGEYANPSFEATVETLSNPNTPMSIEARVEEMWGDTRDEEWKNQEVQRIKAERGIVELEEPALFMRDFDGETNTDDSTGNNPAESVD